MYVVHVKPFEVKLFTRQEIFNEITIMLISYLCICQTDYVFLASAKFNVGYAMDAIIGLNIVILLLPVIYEALRNVKQSIRRRSMLRKDKYIRKVIMKKYTCLQISVILIAG